MKVNGHWNTKLDEQYWTEVYVIRSLLRYVIPRECSRDNEVAIAGSAALCWFQDLWEVGPMWGVPGDVDIFVCGKNGRTKGQFSKFMNSILKKLRQIYRHPSAVECFDSAYCFRGLVCHISNLKIPGISLKLSFISSPGCNNVKEVVDQFDIDVCKVIYNVHHEEYEVEESVKKHIKMCKAMVTDLTFGGSVPDRFDIYKCSKTLGRMEKYTKRGFVFINGGGIRFGIN